MAEPQTSLELSSGSYLMHWPSYFLGSVCKFSVTRAGLHSGNTFWEQYCFASKTISLLLGSCFTVLAEGCQNREILPVISYYAKNKHIDMKKDCKLCELFFTDVPYTDLHKVKRGEQTRLFTLTLSEWHFFLGKDLSNNFFCDIQDVVSIVCLY